MLTGPVFPCLSPVGRALPQVSSMLGHSDYVRSAVSSPVSADVWATSGWVGCACSPVPHADMEGLGMMGVGLGRQRILPLCAWLDGCHCRYDHVCKLWDARQRRCLLTVDHGAPIESVAFFPSGGHCMACTAPRHPNAGRTQLSQDSAIPLPCRFSVGHSRRHRPMLLATAAKWPAGAACHSSPEDNH